MSTTRATLLERIRDSRDGAAWEEFFALYAPLLESYARAFGLSGPDAEDIRDQCLALIAQRIGTFHYDRAKGSFKGWLHRIARDKVVDAMRRPRPDRPETDALLSIPDASEGPDEVWEREWRAEHLRFALAEVRRPEDERGRALIDLLLDESLTTNEIAQKSGLSANQVYKARAKLVHDVGQVMRRLEGDG